MSAFQNQNELNFGYFSNSKPSEKEIYHYVQLMINKSMYSDAIDYINQLQLPPISFSTEFHLNIMEQFVKLLIYQGYFNKAESIIVKVKNRAFDLELVDLYVKLNTWDSKIKKALNREYASLPIYESLDIFFDNINNSLVKSMVLLQGSHLPDFIASQEHFLQESYNLLSKSSKNDDPNYKYVEATILNSMGLFNGMAGDLPKCKTVLEKAIELGKELGDKRRVAGSMINLAYLYFLDTSMSPESQLIGRSMLQEALKITENIGALEYEMMANIHLANYYQKRGIARLAIPFYNKIYEIQTKIGIIEKDSKIENIFDETFTIQESSEQQNG